MKVHPLLLGEFEARENTTFRGGDPSKIVWYSSYAYLIEGAVKPILVDTGYADPQICKERMNHLCRRSEEMTIENRFSNGSRSGLKRSTDVLRAQFIKLA